MRKRKTYVFQIQEQPANSFSGKDGTWATLETNGTVYGEFWTVGGSERFASEKTESVCTHRIKLNSNSALTTKNRILYGSRVFDIVFIGSPDIRTGEIIVEVKEHV